MTILAIDPGTRESAYVEFAGPGLGDPTVIISHGKVSNSSLLCLLRRNISARTHVLVVEALACYGMPAGFETLETAVWTGRFIEAFESQGGVCDRLLRKDVKMHICGTMKSRDSDVRRGLIQRFGGAGANGSKRAPGRLYGIKGDEWAALAVAVSYADGVRSAIKT